MDRDTTLAHEMSIADLLKREGRTLEDIMRGSLFRDENTPALCEDGCEVEADGHCEHGCRSVLLAAGLI
jgi:hypothetical protein